MIKTINNYSYKSFKNYTGPLEYPFKEKNVLFGYNGKGKTALSLGILQELKKDDTITDNNYRFFNKDYIKENLILENGQEIKGVIANFGKENVDIEKEITIKKAQIKELSTDIENKEKVEKAITEEIDRIFTSKKGKSSIKKKTGANINELLDSYKKDLDPAIKLVSSMDELKNVKDSSEYEKELQILSEIKIVEFDFPSKEEISELNVIMNSEYNESEIPSADVISWMREGIAIHTEDNASHCKFCGGEIHIDVIEQKINEYLNNKKQIDLLKVDKILKRIKIIADSNERLDENKLLISKSIGQRVNAFYDVIENAVKELDKVIDSITKKLTNFEKKVEYNNELQVIVNSIEENIIKIKNLKKETEASLNTAINKNNTLIKGSIALELSQNSLIENKLKELDTINNTISEKTNINNTISQEIEMLRKSKSTTSDFAKFINELLGNLGIDFFLDIKENNYIITHKNDNIVLTIDDISEGENNILALLLFYYELFNDKLQRQFKNDIKLIIVDDPISSVDDINKVYVLEIIKKIIAIKKVQVFVFTHVWEDFANICYGKQDIDREGHETPYRFFEIKKNESGSYIKKIKYNETPYMHDFKEIFEFSKLDIVDDLDECEIYHYPNVMRKVLEKFMEFKVSNSSPTLDNIENVKIALCKNVNNVSPKDNLEISTLLDVCNIMSHKSARNPEQVLKSAKYLMRKIKDVDVNHFSTMTN